jgi:hypothetical protein
VLAVDNFDTATTRCIPVTEQRATDIPYGLKHPESARGKGKHFKSLIDERMRLDDRYYGAKIAQKSVVDN